MNFAEVKLRRLSVGVGFFILLSCIPIFAQSRARITVADARSILPGLPFSANEELTFNVELSKFILRGVDVGELTFKVENVAPENEEATNAPPRLRFTGNAESKNALIKLFGLSFRQNISTIVEAKSLRLIFSEKQDIQGKRERNSRTLYDLRDNTLTWIERNPRGGDAPPRTVTTLFRGDVQDLSSVWYHLRAIKKLQPGTTVELQITDSGQVYRIPVRVMERKKLNTLFGKVMTVRLDPQIFGEDRLVSGEGEMSVWLTDDARRAPVKATFSNKLGKLEITLKSALNLVPVKR